MVKMGGSSNKPKDKEIRLNQLYIAIISRYKEYIEEKEGLSVAELPTLIMPNDEKVRLKAEEIKAKFLNYQYDNDFYEASIKAYNFVKSEVEEVVLPLQFWLTPDETLRFMMGDTMDKNILLCSILIKLENPSTKVFVKILEGTRKAFVYYTFKNKIFVLDNDEVPKEFNSKEEMLKSLKLNQETTAYEFNNQMYADIY
jgi:hypothetical protein